jgi:kinesin family member C1
MLDSELETENGELKRLRSDLQRTVDEEKSARSASALALEELHRKQLLESASLKQAIDDQRRAHNNEVDDLMRQKRREVEDARLDAEEEQKRRDRAYRDELADMKKKLETALDEEREQKRKELNAISSEGILAQQKIELELSTKDKTIDGLREELEKLKLECSREKDLTQNLKAKLSEAATNIISLESSLRSSKARVEFLESDSKSQSQAFADLEQKTQDAVLEAEEAKAKLRAEETLRRKLHNQVQELKGNIRVFCRVRPTLETDTADKALIEFPDQKEDSKEIDITGPEEKSSLGTITRKKNAFSFDRVFAPNSQNSDVFDEISQLVQSALDGYNVCIFCYGQTGSGKTFTMSSSDGMIPRAVRQIYETAQSLQEKGWTYSMEGSFVEIYNENINDLLGKAEEFDKKKHEIRHDPQRFKTTITDVQAVQLDSPDKVHSVLSQAMNNRSVAATKANERSSRSHSVFILKLLGENSITGEKSEGTLNLVDLAGSERLSHSGATGDRLKETQNINKSLSCLGDVIAALGQGKEGGHIPYRNSKVTSRNAIRFKNLHSIAHILVTILVRR